jgi:predicted dehydrogenase
MAKLSWGILGTARIARKIWKGVHYSGNSVITAVASRDSQRSKQFIGEHQRENPFDPTPAALGSYEELLTFPGLDVIYVPIPTGLRKEWVVRAAEAGKHVLCEKPCGATVADVREMIEACQRNRVQFMDGVMFMHNPRLNRIHQALDDKTSLGKIRRITSHFSFFSDEDFRQENIRAHGALEPLGCLGDLGWYCIRFALWIMNWQLPREVAGRILSQTCGDSSPCPVPFDFSAELLFENDASSGFFCSFLSAYSNWVNVTGTTGYLRVPDFVLPGKTNEGALEINGQMTENPDTDPATGQETNMVRAFAEQILSGKLNPAWPEWSLKTQIVMNACLESASTGRPVALNASR